MNTTQKLYRVDNRWQVKCCVLDDQLKEGVFNNSFLYFMMNISGSRIVFTSQQYIPVASVVAIKLESTLFPSAIIALGEVMQCKADTSGGSEIEVECWWVGWEEIEVQQQISHFILDALESSTAQK